jgi:hypothetical protein
MDRWEDKPERVHDPEPRPQDRHRTWGPPSRTGQRPSRWRRIEYATQLAEWEVMEFYLSLEEPRA